MGHIANLTVFFFFSRKIFPKSFPWAELSLWGTGVGNAGAKGLASALKQNSTLKNLWLGECNDITDEVPHSTLKPDVHACLQSALRAVGGMWRSMC